MSFLAFSSLIQFQLHVFLISVIQNIRLSSVTLCPCIYFVSTSQCYALSGLTIKSLDICYKLFNVFHQHFGAVAGEVLKGIRVQIDRQITFILHSKREGKMVRCKDDFTTKFMEFLWCNNQTHPLQWGAPKPCCSFVVSASMFIFLQSIFFSANVSLFL